MDANELINEYNSNKARNSQIKKELKQHQKEVAMRAYEALKEAWACGVRFYDIDKHFFATKLYPCIVEDTTKENEDIAIRFTHRPNSDYLVLDFNPKDFPIY